MMPPPLDRLLEQVGFEAADLVRVHADVRQLLSHPKLVDLVAQAAGQQLHLVGTMAIQYKDGEYDIPCKLMLPLSYPHEAPAFFVQPTGRLLLVRNHANVHPTGQVHLPYLDDWHHSNNLVELCTYICSIFSVSPPLYDDAARPQNRPPTYQKPPPPVCEPPPPPPPPAYDSLSPRHFAATSAVPLASRRDRLTKKLKEHAMAEINEEIDSQFRFRRLKMEAQAKLDATTRLKAILERELGTLTEQTRNLRTRLEHDEAPQAQPANEFTQLLHDKLAENSAIEDVLYGLDNEDAPEGLDQALYDGTLELDPYLKDVRMLSGKQFACITKIKTQLKKR